MKCLSLTLASSLCCSSTITAFSPSTTASLSSIRSSSAFSFEYLKNNSSFYSIYDPHLDLLVLQLLYFLMQLKHFLVILV